jgi:hypothetical protein
MKPRDSYFINHCLPGTSYNSEFLQRLADLAWALPYCFFPYIPKSLGEAENTKLVFDHFLIGGHLTDSFRLDER